MYSNMEDILIKTAKCQLVRKVNRTIMKFQGVQDMDNKILVYMEKKDILQLDEDLYPSPTKVLSI